MEIIKEGEPGYKSYFIEGSKNSETTKAELWRQAKWGKFSASQEFHLMVPGKNGNVFSVGGETYIEGVALEGYTIFNDESTVETFAMRRGKMNEAIAYARLRDVLKFDGLEHYGGDNPVFDLYTEDSGVSPDCKAIAKDGTVSFGAEIKCPGGKMHMHYLRHVKDQFDLKKESEEYYTQVQKALLTYKCDVWLWSSYNEYFPLKDQTHIIEVKPDKQFQQNLDIRIRMATKKKYEIIEELKAL